MSARDDVLNTMGYALEWGGSKEDNIEELNAYRDEVLREAAEKQRGHLETAECEHGGLYSPDVPWGLPDLIDPEVGK